MHYRSAHKFIGHMMNRIDTIENFGSLYFKIFDRKYITKIIKLLKTKNSMNSNTNQS